MCVPPVYISLILVVPIKMNIVKYLTPCTHKEDEPRLLEHLRKGAGLEQDCALFGLLLCSERFAYTVTKVLLDLGETGKVPDGMTLGPALSLLGGVRGLIRHVVIWWWL